jgi:thiosulfate dehydrogenase [quinone] large subunit
MGLVTEIPTEAQSVPEVNPSSPGQPPSVIADRSESPDLSNQSIASRLDHNLRISDWLFRSRKASVLWLIVRLWLGYQWLNAGYQKIWGAERSFFWFGGGAGVKGFATAGIVGSASGKGGASYGWWAAFLHNFVVPNASWIAKLVSLGEVLVGVALILGLLTGVAAGVGLLLNLTYMFSGSAGVNPMFAILGVLLLLAWRNSGWIGLDRFVLRDAWTPHHFGNAVGRFTHRPVSVAHVTH